MKDNVDTSDLNDPKMMKTILEALQTKKKKQKEENHPHFKRNSTIAKNETGNFNIHAPEASSHSTSQEIIDQLYNRLASLGERAPKYLEELKQKFANNEKPQDAANAMDDNSDNIEESGMQKRHDHAVLETQGRQYKKPAVNFNKDIDNRRRRREVTSFEDLAKDDSENNHANEEVHIYCKRKIICFTIYFFFHLRASCKLRMV